MITEKPVTSSRCGHLILRSQSRVIRRVFNENRKLSCPSSPSAGFNHSVSERSTCPWVSYIEEDPRRLPRVLIHQACLCDQSCSGPAAGHHSLCGPLHLYVPVWFKIRKRNKNDGYQLVQCHTKVTTGCTCAQQRKHAQKKIKSKVNILEFSRKKPGINDKILRKRFEHPEHLFSVYVFDKYATDGASKKEESKKEVNGISKCGVLCKKKNRSARPRLPRRRVSDLA